jgi:hypothetical protein
MQNEPLPRYKQIVEVPAFYEHWKDALQDWDTARWSYFWPGEHNIACPLTGNFYLDPVAFDYLQLARRIVGKIFKINSGHRSPEHNKAVGGAKESAHLKIAFDISLHGHDRFEVHEALVKAGFTSFGFYKTFIHTDTRKPARTWYGEGAKALWERET